MWVGKPRSGISGAAGCDRGTGQVLGNGGEPRADSCGVWVVIEGHQQRERGLWVCVCIPKAEIAGGCGSGLRGTIGTMCGVAELVLWGLYSRECYIHVFRGCVWRLTACKVAGSGELSALSISVLSPFPLLDLLSAFDCWLLHDSQLCLPLVSSRNARDGTGMQFTDCGG